MHAIGNLFGWKQMRVPKVCINRFHSMIQDRLIVDNPYTGDVVYSEPYDSMEDIKRKYTISSHVQKEYYANSCLEDRIVLCERVLQYFEQNKNEIAEEITCQMGKPKSQAMGEIAGLNERTDAMCKMAPKMLCDPIRQYTTPQHSDLRIIREPVGIVMTLAPYNYPLLTAINSIVPAILSGNALLLCHGPRVPLCAKRFESAFMEAGAPEGLLTSFSAPISTIHQAILECEPDHVCFTGSVQGGREVYQSLGKAKTKFIDCTLELGGKDAAYVAPDADVVKAAEVLVDAAFYNAGQSCCGVERIYVHSSVYQDFTAFVQHLVEQYTIGNPMDELVNLGPMANNTSITLLENQIQNALNEGATILTGGHSSIDSVGKGRFFLPTVLENCTSTMDVMSIESFGPIVGVAQVDADDEALQLMNNSIYGLTASVFTTNKERAEYFARRLDVGTVFMNRADYLDPKLPWQGRKLTGKGQSLSEFGFHAFSKLKNFHFME